MPARRLLKRRTALIGSALSAVLVLAGCASPTPYQPADGGFGYRQQQLEENRYRISFSGNSLTPRETVENYLLYRAAEVTVENGHDYFILTDDNLERSTRYYGTVDPWIGGRRNRFGDPFGDPFSPATVRARPIDEYRAFADILMFSGQKPADDPRAYDAHDVLNRLGPAIVREPA